MRYRSIFIAIVGIIIAIILSRQPFFHDFIRSLTDYSYFGAIIIGVFFVSTLTVATAAVALVYLAEAQNSLMVALLAGIGALLGDLLIFRFVKDHLTSEITALLDRIPYFRRRHVVRFFHHKYLAWFLPVVGAVIIASPLPDELGVCLLGITKIKPYRFMIISYLLNAGGIYLLLLLANA